MDPDAVDEALALSTGVSTDHWNDPATRARLALAADALGDVWPGLSEDDPRWVAVTTRLATFRFALYNSEHGRPEHRDGAIACYRRLLTHRETAPAVQGTSRLALGLLLALRAMPEQMAATVRGAMPGAQRGVVPGMNALQAMGPLGAPGPPGSADDLADADAHLRAVLDDERLPEELRAMAPGLLAMVTILRALRGDAPMSEAMSLVTQVSSSWPVGTPGGLELGALTRLAFNAADAPPALDALTEAPPADHDTAAGEDVLDEPASAVDDSTSTSDYPRVLRRLADQLLGPLADSPDEAGLDDLVARAAAVCDQPRPHGRDRLLLGLALALRARSRQRMDDLDGAVDEMRRALASPLLDEPEGMIPAEMLGVLLTDRFIRYGELDETSEVASDIHRADAVLARSDGLPVAAGVRALRGYGALCRGLATRDLDALTTACTELEAAAADLPPGSSWLAGLDATQAVAALARGVGRGDENGVRRAAERLEQLGAEAPTAAIRARTGFADLLRGLLVADPALASAGSAALEAALDEPAPAGAWPRWPRFHYAAALARLAGVGPDGGDRADDLIEAAGTAPTARLLWAVATAHLTRGDHRRALATSAVALRQSVGDVVLRSGTAQSLEVARAVAARAAATVVTCLDGDDTLIVPAVEALEVGREALVYAATTPTTVPQLLRKAGRDDLARQSERSEPMRWIAPWTTSGSPLAIGDLALFGVAAADDAALSVLPAPGTPSVEAIVEGLRATGTDALVYLVPPTADAPGRAILIQETGRLLTWSLTELTAEALAGHTRMLDHVRADLPSAGRHAEVEAVCVWAWRAVLASVTARTAEWELDRPARLTLVPCGPLGLVPWHAAMDGAGRYVCQDTVIAYASTAEQFLTVARRERLIPAADAMFVADPSPGAVWSRRSVRSIADAYPGATISEPGGPGPADGALAEVVLDRLSDADRPPASLLHLGCPIWHAAVPTRSYLAFGQDPDKSSAWLTVDRVLRQASQRHEHPSGGTLVLPNCRSDVSAPEHDDATGLATTFLAAGAATVISAAWPVADLPGALFAAVLHHFLREQPGRPADALRAAQLWMLDPNRPAPSDLLALRANELQWSDEGTAVDRLELAAPACWGAFTIHGTGFVPASEQSKALNQMLAVVVRLLPDLMDNLPPMQGRRLLVVLDSVRRDGPDRHSAELIDLLADYLPPDHPVHRAYASREGRSTGSAVLDETAELLRALGAAVDEAMTAITEEPAPAPWREVLARAKATLLGVPGVVAEDIRSAGHDPAASGLVALPRADGRLHYPSFQFDADGAPRDIVRIVNDLLSVEQDPWGVAGWWMTPNAWLGEAPAAVTDQDREPALLQAARIAKKRD